MKQRRLFRPGGCVPKRTLILRTDASGVEVSRFRVRRDELEYMRAIGKLPAR